MVSINVKNGIIGYFWCYEKNNCCFASGIYMEHLHMLQYELVNDLWIIVFKTLIFVTYSKTRLKSLDVYVYV